MKVLLDKVGSRYPLWLTLACEELRVYGVFETLINKIGQLPDDLIRFVDFSFKTSRVVEVCVLLDGVILWREVLYCFMTGTPQLQ